MRRSPRSERQSAGVNHVPSDAVVRSSAWNVDCCFLQCFCDQWPKKKEAAHEEMLHSHAVCAGKGSESSRQHDSMGHPVEVKRECDHSFLMKVESVG